MINPIIAILVAIILAIGFVSFVLLYYPEDDTTVTMFLTDWAPYGFVYVAQEKGFFESNNLNVELKLLDETNSLITFPRGFTADGSMEVIIDAMTISSTNTPSQIVYVLDESGDADVVVSKLSSIGDLEGKTIGVWEIGGFSHLFLISLLEQNGLTANDVVFREIDPDSIVENLDLGYIDAGHTFNQYNLDKAKDSGYSIIATERDTPGLIVDGIMFKNSFIENNPEAVLNFVKSFSEAQEYCKTNSDECAKIIALEFGWEPSDVLEGFSNVDLLYFDDNVELISNTDSPLYESGSFALKKLQEHGHVSYPHDIESMINPKFVNQMAGLSP